MAVIPSGGTKTEAIPLDGLIVGVRLPSSFTGTSISFEESATQDGTFRPITQNGSALSYTVAASDTLKFQFPSVFAGIKWLKIVSGSAEAADRTITPITIPY